MKMMKIALLTIMLMGSVGVHAKNIAIPKEAIGHWQYPDGSSDEDSHITNKGVKWIVDLPKKCQYHKVTYVTGRKLLANIKESIAYDLTDKRYVQMALKLIQPNQKYWQIERANKCGDGGGAFILLDANHALSMVSGPEELYIDLHK